MGLHHQETFPHDQVLLVYFLTEEELSHVVVRYREIKEEQFFFLLSKSEAQSLENIIHRRKQIFLVIRTHSDFIVQEGFQILQLLYHMGCYVALDFSGHFPRLNFKVKFLANCLQLVLNMIVRELALLSCHMVFKHLLDFWLSHPFVSALLQQHLRNHSLLVDVAHVHVDHLLDLSLQSRFHEPQIVTLLLTVDSVQIQVRHSLLLRNYLIFVKLGTRNHVFVICILVYFFLVNTGRVDLHLPLLEVLILRSNLAILLRYCVCRCRRILLGHRVLLGQRVLLTQLHFLPPSLDVHMSGVLHLMS